MKTVSEMKISVKRLLRNWTTSLDTEILKWINDSQNEIARLVVPSSATMNGSFYNLASISDSTITATMANGSATISFGSAHGITSAYKGQKIKIDSTKLFTIKTVPDTTSITTWETNNYSAISATDWKAYQVAVPFPSNILKVNTIYRHDNTPLILTREEDFFDRYNLYFVFGEPTHLIYRGNISYPVDSSDISGATISASAASSTLTLSTTVGDTNFVTEDIIVETHPQRFKITARPTTSTYTVTPKTSAAISVKNYTIRPKDTPILTFYPIPDNLRMYQYSYVEKPKMLVADTDISELREDLHDFIFERVWLYAKASSGMNDLNAYMLWKSKLLGQASGTINDNISVGKVTWDNWRGQTGTKMNFEGGQRPVWM